MFLLYRGHDRSMREVAARLSISEKTVEKHIARAMVHCRAQPLPVPPLDMTGDILEFVVPMEFFLNR